MVVLNTLVPLLALFTLAPATAAGTCPPVSFGRPTGLYLDRVACAALLSDCRGNDPRRRSVARFLTLLAGMAASIALGYLVAFWLRLSRTSVGAFVQGAYRSNLAYVGLPVVLLALAAAPGHPMAGSNSLAVLSVAFLIPIYNLIAVIVLLAGRPVTPDAGHTARRMLTAMLTNPLVISCAAGLIFMILDWKLPPVIRQTCVTLGQMSTGLALLNIGASLTLVSLRPRIVPAGAYR